jgi:Fe-S-cluster containining protein
MTVRIDISDKLESDVLDFIQYLSHHSSKSFIKDNMLTILIPNICKNFIINNDGVGECKIYNNKPEICNQFLCDKAKGE